MQIKKIYGGYYSCSYGITIEKRDNRWMVQGPVGTTIYDWFDTFKESKAYVSQIINAKRGAK
jgi:hypothetical protein